ncbi:hypothetical protein NOVA_35775 [Nocardia nova]|uniref:hypothetical protein n=1 Tax=Nocardia nova TaxID=37330 RepID=UPI001C45AD8C|nr:hypothetical protein [Nocardia nova]MBV7708150.1 hypothetical protein [Nocardia nova]
MKAAKSPDIDYTVAMPRPAAAHAAGKRRDPTAVRFAAEGLATLQKGSHMMHARDTNSPVRSDHLIFTPVGMNFKGPQRKEH